MGESVEGVFRVLLFMVLFMPSCAGSQVLLFAVAPDLRGSNVGDEGLAIWSAEPVDLIGFKLTDGEGAWPVPSLHLQPGRPVWFTGNASTWASFDGPPAAGEWGGALSLAGSGDNVELVDAHGAVVDGFAWGTGISDGMVGSVRHTSPGLVYRRLGGSDPADSDRAQDWVTPRTHRIGESDLDQPTWTVDRLTLYSSPDSSHQVLLDLIRSAQHRLHLHVYELRSETLVEALAQARLAHPALDLQVFVDGSPVGMTQRERDESAYALQRVAQVGGHAFLSGTGRYDDHHLKVLVADDAVAVQSENWVPSGVPADPSWGNRGWGVVVHGSQPADWFASWLRDDRSAWDTVPFDLDVFDPFYSEPARTVPNTGEYGPIRARVLTGTFTATPIVSPEHTSDGGLLASRIRNARDRVWMQELDLALESKNALGWSAHDPLALALLDAASAGADVRIQLASPFAPDDTGNADAIASLTASAPDLRAVTLERPGIATLHNKGIIVDDAVLLGSTNGNHHSRSENREVSILLEGPEVVQHYADLFISDWSPPSVSRDWSVPGQDLRALPATPLPMLLAGLGLVATVRRL